VVRKAGGVISLAHPGPIYSQTEIDEIITLGVDGLECIHPSHNFNVQRTFKHLAESRNLLITGGSDFHGTGKSDYDPYFGIVTIGNTHVASLKRLSQRRK
jgi:3',5'-nucleoside bisphosphate phosphatase